MLIAVLQCSWRVSEYDQMLVASALRMIVSRHLDEQGNPLARIVPADVEVKSHSRRFNRFGHDIQVTVLLDQKREDIDDRVGSMAAEFGRLLGERPQTERVTGFCHVCLIDGDAGKIHSVDAGFAEFSSVTPAE